MLLRFAAIEQTIAFHVDTTVLQTTYNTLLIIIYVSK